MPTIYLTCTILSMIWTLGDFNSVYLLTGGGPADLTHVLATLGIRYLRLGHLVPSMAASFCAQPPGVPPGCGMVRRLGRIHFLPSARVALHAGWRWLAVPLLY